MFDRRVNDWIHLNAFLFHASFSDGLDIEIQVNPEFGDQNTALAEALRYAPVIGRLPTSLRADVETVWIHRGDEPFGGGNNNILIHTDRADQSSASGILEETLVHEAAHTSLDADHATAPEWFAAQTADGEFISTFARDHPIREDVAESFLVYLALRHRSERISQSLVETISQTIPNRVAYFDSQEFDMNPIVVPDGKGPSPLLIAGSADFVNDGTEFQGNVYNGFEINSRAATFSSEAGTITRISFLDPAGDLMFAEFGSDDPSTILTISPENYLAAVPSPYNQPATTYAQGLPTFTIENATPLTFFSTFTLGNDTSRIDVALINSQTFSGDVNGIADIRLIRVDSKGGETTKIGGINAASANFIASEGIIGIDALDVIVEMFLFIGDITPSGSTLPVIRISPNSSITEIQINGGDLGEAIEAFQIDTNDEIYPFPFAATDGQRSIIDSPLRPDIGDGRLQPVLDTFFENTDNFFQTDGQSVIAIVPEE